MDQEFLMVNDFSCGYSTFQLQHISFSLSQGIFAGIIGPNGSGKTTFFKGLTGILPTLEGNISLKGRDLCSFSLKEKAQHIAVVSQTVDAGPIRVKDYVMMGRMPYHGRFQFFETNQDIQLAHRYMELTDVLLYKDKLMNELSGGEQQRVAIARALTQEPSLLLLDEPTSHLDISHQVKILNLLQRLNEEMGLTVLMVIHDLNLASEYCQKLIMFDHGKIYIEGSPEEVLSFNHIEQVYQTVVVTRTNPYSGKPVVFLISEKASKSSSH